MLRYAIQVCVVAVCGCSGSSANAPQNGEPPCLRIRSAQTASQGADGGGFCPKVDSEPLDAPDAAPATGPEVEPPEPLPEGPE
jgi:hypothetical protein